MPKPGDIQCRKRWPWASCGWRKNCIPRVSPMWILINGPMLIISVSTGRPGNHVPKHSSLELRAVGITWLLAALTLLAVFLSLGIGQFNMSPLAVVRQLADPFGPD